MERYTFKEFIQHLILDENLEHIARYYMFIIAAPVNFSRRYYKVLEDVERDIEEICMFDNTKITLKERIIIIDKMIGFINAPRSTDFDYQEALNMLISLKIRLLKKTKIHPL